MRMGHSAANSVFSQSPSAARCICCVLLDLRGLMQSSVLVSVGIKVLKTVHHSVWSWELEIETQQCDLQRGVRGRQVMSEDPVLSSQSALLSPSGWFIFLPHPHLLLPLHLLHPDSTSSILFFTSLGIIVPTDFYLFLCLILLIICSTINYSSFPQSLHPLPSFPLSVILSRHKHLHFYRSC